MTKGAKLKWRGEPLRDAWKDYEKIHGDLSLSKIARQATELLGSKVSQQVVSLMLSKLKQPRFAVGCAVCTILKVDPLEMAVACTVKEARDVPTAPVETFEAVGKGAGKGKRRRAS